MKNYNTQDLDFNNSMELTNNIVNLDQIVLKKNTRIDKIGKAITKGEKKHKVTFIDEIEKGK